MTLFPERLWVANDSIQLYKDSSSGSTGGLEIFFQDKWAFGRWPQHWSDLGRQSNMTFLDFFPVVMAISVWDPLLANKRILFHIDIPSYIHIC